MGTRSKGVTALPKAAARGGENAAAAATGDIVGSVIRLAPPWLTVATLPGAAEGCHLLWGQAGSAPWAAMGMTVSTIGLSALAWKVSHARRLLGRLHVVANTALSLGWVTVATITGLHHPEVDVWLWGGFTAALAWNFRNRLHGGADDDDRLRGWWATRSEKASLGGSQMETLAVGTDRGTARLELAEGQTVDDAVRNREVVAAMAGVPANGVRIAKDPDDAGVAQVTFVRRDMLRDVTPWAGPTHVGGLPTDPHELGTYEDGLRFAITLAALPGDPDRGIPSKNAYHVGIGGKNGAGKSGPPLIIAADWLCRRESVVIVIDTVKRMQTFGPLADLLNVFVTAPKDAKALIKAIRRGLVPAIGDYLGARGLPNWEPGCGIPAFLLVIEEFLALGDDSKEDIVALSQQIRSLGIHLLLSGQRWTYDNVPTSARAEIGGAMQFGCADGDAGYLLGDLADQGADPATWGNRHPGRAYAVVPDVPDERHLIPLRVDNAPPAVVGRRVRPHHIHTELPDFLAAALGDAYANRPRYPAPDDIAGGGDGWTPPLSAVPPTAAAGDDPEEFDPMSLTAEPDEDPTIQPGPDDPVPHLGRFPLVPPPARKATPEEVRTEVQRLIAAWGPGTEFRPVDIARALPDYAARHRSTVSRLLSALVDEDHLIEVSIGLYRVPDTRAA